jgi:hypothetical protein
MVDFGTARTRFRRHLLPYTHLVGERIVPITKSAFRAIYSVKITVAQDALSTEASRALPEHSFLRHLLSNGFDFPSIGRSLPVMAAGNVIDNDTVDTCAVNEIVSSIISFEIAVGPKSSSAPSSHLGPPRFGRPDITWDEKTTFPTLPVDWSTLRVCRRRSMLNNGGIPSLSHPSSFVMVDWASISYFSVAESSEVLT